jgi:hypothetical protein
LSKFNLEICNCLAGLQNIVLLALCAKNSKQIVCGIVSQRNVIADWQKKAPA